MAGRSRERRSTATAAPNRSVFNPGHVESTAGIQDGRFRRFGPSLIVPLHKIFAVIMVSVKGRERNRLSMVSRRR